ncbi:MAG: hypothetical protein JRG89_24200 [Deltaproteobacteria bacterium]|nr:hypothetical protein [Deltaproteobacteria bacterium]
MSRRLQDRSFDRSRYERPDRTWVCGHAGRECPLGPDARGECITTHECQPYREGDRWMCARPTQFGGECAGGPLPDGTCCNTVATCQPRLSVRALRGRTVRWTVTMTIGLLAIALSGERALDFVFPGPVTHQHGTIEGDCASCHGAGAGGPAVWVGTAVAGTDRASDSERCLTCHNLGPSSMIAHSVPAVDLEQATERMRQGDPDTSRPIRFSLASMGPGIPIRSGGELACAVCHQEHQGADHDLTALTNDQCQVCHLVQFDRFALDHPPLGEYPYGRRTRIVFNHQTHRDDYYPDEEREIFGCIDCHAPEPTGRTMTIKDFATICGDCHDGDVRSAGKGGVAFINLPALDGRGLRRVGVDIGQWPRVERPRAPSPFVGFLLAGEDRLSDPDRQAVAQIGEGLSDLSRNTHFEQQAAGRYAWSLKLLLHDLRESGHSAIESRLRSAREIAVFREVTRDLDLFEEMSREHWAAINRGLRDLARQRAGSSGATNSGKDPEENWVREGGWYRSSKDAAIRYRSRGHADPFARAWFDLSGGFAHTGDHAGDAASAAEQLFSDLRQSTTTGKCALCHSIDPAASRYGSLGSARQLNWQSFRPEPNRRLPTEFRHQPHFSLDDADRCDTCHKMRDLGEEEFDEAYKEDTAAAGHVLNFEPIALRVCGECHTQRAAGDNCVSCHNYHQGESIPIYLTATQSDIVENTAKDDDGGEDEEDGEEE